MPEEPDPRQETTAQRDDRNLMELLQELRVAGLGVQVLFGFLLSLPFTTKFVQLSHAQRVLYTVILLASALATAQLVAPVAYHRVLFRQRQKEQLVRAANLLAIGGLLSVALAIAGTVLLVISYIYKGSGGIVAGACVLAVFGCLWFAYPLARRERAARRESR